MAHIVDPTVLAETAPSGSRRWGSGTRRLGLAVLVGTATTLAVAGCSSTGSANPTSPPSATPSPPAAAHRQPGAVGQITAINGSTWTVHTMRGKDITVTLTPTTQFGTKATPASAQAFKVGDTVYVIGKRDNSAITATRISTAHPAAASAQATPAPAGGQTQP